MTQNKYKSWKFALIEVSEEVLSDELDNIQNNTSTLHRSSVSTAVRSGNQLHAEVTAGIRKAKLAVWVCEAIIL